MSKFALLFLLLFFGGLIGAFFASPVFAVVLYQLVYFMNPESRWWASGIPSISYSFITVIVMIVSLLIHYSKLSQQTKWREQPVFKWIVLLLLIYYMTGFFAILPSVHYQFCFEFLKLVVILFVVYKIIGKPSTFDAVVWAYIIGAAYIGYYAGFVGRNSAGRVEGIGMIDTGGDSNLTAAALVPAIVMLLYYVWLGSFKIRLLCVICAAFVVNGLIMINSRGSFIGCVVGGSIFLGYMIFSKWQKPGQRVTAYGIILFGLIGALSLTDASFWERMSTLKAVEDGDASGSHRIDFWLATFDVMRDHPMGVGISGFEAVSRFYLPQHYFETLEAKAVHSSWFQLLNEAGWFGLACFGILLVALLKQLNATKKFLLSHNLTERYFHVLSLEAGFIGYLGAATFINRIRAEALWWCILFLMIATNIYYLQYKNGHKKIESLKDETEKKRS
jgi:hypothetical protein